MLFQTFHKVEMMIGLEPQRLQDQTCNKLSKITKPLSKSQEVRKVLKMSEAREGVKQITDFSSALGVTNEAEEIVSTKMLPSNRPPVS